MIQLEGNHFVLANGVKVPAIGLGCGYATPYPFEKLTKDILYAMDHGYRMFDTATQYLTEDAVGSAVEHATVPREELYIATKLHNDAHDNPFGAFEISRQFLRVDYVDQYLIHWPGLPGHWKFVDVWKAFEEMYMAGKIRVIGVSNFLPKHLEEIMNKCEIVPMVNQMERHPFYQQWETVEFCRQNNILVEASTPLGNQRSELDVMPLNHPVILRLAEKYGKSAGQIILRWHLDTGVAAVPRSGNPKRIIDNISVFDFQLTPDELEEIKSIDCGYSLCPHPDTFFYQHTINSLMAKRYAKNNNIQTIS